MHAFVLQDWTTIRSGGVGTSTITQAEAEWLDLEPYQDVVFWVQVSESSGGVTMNYQTSPTKDDSIFLGMLPTALTLAVSTFPSISQVLMLSASVPLARYVRWQLSGSGAWDATFRIMVAANAPGL